MEKEPKYEYGPGCFSDQLLGQWWAHQLDLGYILPPEQVKTTVSSIAKYNWRENFVGFKQDPRVFASEHDQGLLICSWPKGGRPQVPTLYSDEVWTGIEYEVAALLFSEGLTATGMKIIRGVHGRYDGRERSPWNNVECGDHYSRAMSSWALLEAVAGHHYHAPSGRLAFAPQTTPENFRCLFLGADGWGTFQQQISGNAQKNVLTLTYGKTRLRELELAFQAGRKPQKVSATLRGESLGFASHFADQNVRLTSNREVEMNAGDTLSVEIS
jgi:non-lysosomal glucosylceramidase